MSGRLRPVAVADQNLDCWAPDTLAPWADALWIVDENDDIAATAEALKRYRPERATAAVTAAAATWASGERRVLSNTAGHRERRPPIARPSWGKKQLSRRPHGAFQYHCERGPRLRAEGQGRAFALQLRAPRTAAA